MLALHVSSVPGVVARPALVIHLDSTSFFVAQEGPDTGGERFVCTLLEADSEGLCAALEVLNARQLRLRWWRPLRGDGSALELAAEGGGDARAHLLALRERLASTTTEVAFQKDEPARTSKRLVVFDMDSTLIQVEVIDELARLHGVFEQVSEVTRRAMLGELDFEQSLRERVALLRGLEMDRAQHYAATLPLMPGAEELCALLHKSGIRTAVISGGFTFGASLLQARLGLDDAFANELEVEAGRLTGRVLGRIVGPDEKARIAARLCEKWQCTRQQLVAVGDGANDVAMLAEAGLGVAFHAKPKLRQAADVALNTGSLTKLTLLWGWPA